MSRGRAYSKSNLTTKTKDELSINNVLEFGTKFIKDNNIEDEDLSQDVYSICLEGLNHNSTYKYIRKALSELHTKYLLDLDNKLNFEENFDFYEAENDDEYNYEGFSEFLMNREFLRNNNINSYIFNDIINKIFEENILTDREKNIIEMRYALNGHIEMTLIEIAKEYNISKARVNKIEMNALEKLKIAIEKYIN